MGESQREDEEEAKNWRFLTKKEDGITETSLLAPFSFDYVEKQLRKKNFGIGLSNLLALESKNPYIGSSTDCTIAFWSIFLVEEAFSYLASSSILYANKED